MKLPFKRSKPKKARAADVLASVAGLWSDLQISKRASKTVKTGARKPSCAKRTVGSTASSTRARSVAAVALLGGVGALVARKRKGDSPEQVPYVPPPPAEPSTDTASQSVDAAPVGAAMPDRTPDEVPIVVEEAPIVVEELAAQEPSADQADPAEPAADEPEAQEPDAREPIAEENDGQEPQADDAS